MTTDEKLDLILKKLTAIEERLNVIPDALEVGSIVGTTASHDEVNEIKDTLDYIADQLDEQDKKQVLREIRQSIRRAS